LEGLEEDIVRVVKRAWRARREEEWQAEVEEADGLEAAFAARAAAYARGDTAEAERLLQWIQTVPIPNEDPYFTSTSSPAQVRELTEAEKEELEAEAEAQESAIEELEERQQERAAHHFTADDLEWSDDDADGGEGCGWGDSDFA